MSAYGRYLSFPFRIDESGRTALVPDLNQHVRDEIIQLILTAVGERLFVPDFGTNVSRLVFENADDTVAGLTKATVANALQQWLGHRVHVDALDVEFVDATINVTVSYRVAGGGANTVTFQRQVGG